VASSSGQNGVFPLAISAIPADTTTAADLEHIDSKGLQQIMLQHVALTG
jgi:hypothetical protein